MKKLIIASAIALATSAASAYDVTVTGGRSFAGNDNNFGRVAVASNPLFYKTSVVGELTGSGDYNQYGFGVKGDYFKLGPVAVGGKALFSYVDRAGSNPNPNGYAFTPGVTFTYPIDTRTSLIGAYEYRFGQSRVEDLNGNVLSAGVKYSF